MVGKDIDPSDIGKHPKLIKAAQEDMAHIDVLVCGHCLNVFHFIEEFKEHKNSFCSRDIETSNIRDCPDTKPKIWAFLLWKAAQLNKENTTNGHNSWTLYQTWVKMEESVRETWIVAGKTIQSFAKISQGGLQEMPVKITKTVVDSTAQQTKKTPPVNQSKPIVANLKPALKAAEEKQEPITMIKNETSPVTQSATQRIVNKKPMVTTLTSPKKIVPSTLVSQKKEKESRCAKRTNAATNEITEENVEKIVAKRFNPRRKMHEFLVKWEGRTHENNTWEPQIHLENIPQILEIFEKQLARQKEQRAAMQAKQQAAALASAIKVVDIGAKKDNSNSIGAANNSIKLSSPSGGVGQPLNRSLNSTTNSEDKLNLLSPSNSDSSKLSTSRNLSNSTSFTGIKRKLNESDMSDTISPMVTEEDLEEDLIPSHTVKRMKNGDCVSVKVETKHDRVTTVESKVIKLNGAIQNSNEAEVIITQDVGTSGVVKKPGFNGVPVSTSGPPKAEAQIRVLPKGESQSGIVRINDDSSGQQQRSIINRSGVQQQKINVGNTQITQITENPSSRVVQRNVTGTIQRQNMKPSAAGNSSSRLLQTTPKMTTLTQRTTLSPGIQQISPTSGRMIIPRNVKNQQPQQQTKAVTPEQKILQLSKSGDLKVTKKVMSKEPMTNQGIRQQQQQQRGQQQQQIQIQKVQQIVPPGKLLGQSNDQLNQDQLQQLHQLQQSGVLITTSDQQQLQLQQQHDQELQEIDPALLLSGDSQLLTNEDGTPLLVTGDDGTVYQVAGKNAEGQTILVAHGANGEQQYAYVAAADGDESGVLTLDNAVAEAVAQLSPDQQAEALALAAAQQGAAEGQYILKTQEDGTTGLVSVSEAELAQHQAALQQQAQQQHGQLSIQTESESGESQDTNIPAEVVQADLPSPGGTRRVVLLLQDGTFMMTEMHDDEYKALNITA